MDLRSMVELLSSRDVINRGYMEFDLGPVHLGDKTLFDDKITNIPWTIGAPAEANERPAVRFGKDPVGNEKLGRRFNDLGEGWRTVRLVLWCSSDVPQTYLWRRLGSNLGYARQARAELG
jgi:hypothetical protein